MGLRIALLGSLRVATDGGDLSPVRLGRRERGVLVLLALQRGHVVPMSRLVDELWPEEPPETAANTVQVYVSRIRRALGKDAVRSDPAGYALNLEPSDLDVAEFERLAERGARALRAGRYAQAADAGRQALTLWQATALVDGTDLPAVRAEAVRLTELRLSVLEDQVEADLALGLSRSCRKAPILSKSRYLDARTAAEHDLENYREALRWTTCSSNAALERTGLRLVTALSWLWVSAGYLAEGLGLYERVIEVTDRRPSPELAKCLASLGYALAITANRGVRCTLRLRRWPWLGLSMTKTALARP